MPATGPFEIRLVSVTVARKRLTTLSRYANLAATQFVATELGVGELGATHYTDCGHS